MALSEYESRILRELEDSLHDVERRCAVVQRHMRRRQSRLGLILLCLTTPLAGAGLITLGAMAAGGGIMVALLGSVVLAVPCACVSPLCSRWLPQPAELHEATPKTERP